MHSRPCSPESVRALARHYTHIAELVLSRWLAAGSTTVDHPALRTGPDQLETARGLLRTRSATVPATRGEPLRRWGRPCQASRKKRPGSRLSLPRDATEPPSRNEWDGDRRRIGARPRRAARARRQPPDRLLSRFICAGDSRCLRPPLSASTRVPGQVHGHPSLDVRPSARPTRVDCARFFPGGTQRRSRRYPLTWFCTSRRPGADPLWLEEGRYRLGLSAPAAHVRAPATCGRGTKYRQRWSAFAIMPQLPTSL
jgi:hypothetical protein